MPGNKSVKGMAAGDATTLWRNARLATFDPSMEGIGAVENAVIAVRGGRIAFAGPENDLPADLAAADEITDCGGRWITPSLIDCHTHLVFGGNRAMEFEMRLNGATYEEIAKAGGGIVSSVRDTRAISEDALVAQALPRLDTLLAEGISTIEIKSGYGLAIETELKMLRVARRLATLRPVRIVTSYLAAHATPAEYKGRNADYIIDVVLPGLEKAHAEGLVDAVDGFCEGIAFSVEEITRVFEKARQLGLPVKLHAEQLSDLGGAKLAASYGALSADHLEYLDEAGANALAKAGTVAVLLPGAFYALREKQAPPVQALRDAGATIALATDCNPGTSPLTSLLLTMNMGATLFHMTVEECLTATTRNAAKALGLLAETGTLEAGKSADFTIWDIERPAELVYRIGFNPLHAHIFKGQKVSP
ncbi:MULTISPECIES: imidazolonepropionase [Rhizobium/Agrobacterium group]|uniref:Imidazolonepropionase n=1 Tax=Agrobacterium tomkonis CFBP 6623 TaxID=1183432 RepID=A0A1S7RDU9_9HYPH|nr:MULTISPECIES: imidazolonepropionase [Rhizobium/Agrobacterium group]KRA68568.1 imidazolonepropionase [Rhizobium sp. Root651]QCL91462.1 imidazolonepropionase [Agrobacterium tumefaciens]TKT57037.1 imidazolonepropionase [Agrobacterium sp. LC34]CUX50956.1 Imidazolonepropionase (Imidazolone-5-propionate hydrolase) [Agrobacterium tomkonis CFBP 6623]